MPVGQLRRFFGVSVSLLLAFLHLATSSFMAAVAAENMVVNHPTKWETLKDEHHSGGPYPTQLR